MSYLKAPEDQDGHPGYSDPLDEQKFLVNEINAIEKSKYWASTAIVVTYDDSDGWYDHQCPEVINGSNDTADRRRDLHLGRGDHRPPTTAAATASGCRSWSSRPTPGTTTSAAT